MREAVYCLLRSLVVTWQVKGAGAVRPARGGELTRRETDREPRKRMKRLRWVIGTPYFVQGTTSLTEIPILYFIKFVLGMGDAGGQLFDALRQLGWFVKPLWGLISDKVPLLGYHRKSWYVLMALLASASWTLNALLAFAGLEVPLAYLVGFNLAFAAYAFVDVVCDALMVTHGRRLGRVGSLVNFQWAVLGIANAASVYLGGWLQGRIQSGDIEPWVVFLLTGVPPLATAAAGLWLIDEERVTPAPGPGGGAPRLRRAREAAAGLFRRLRQARARFRSFRRRNRPIWLLVLFIFFWRFSPSVGFIERSYLIDVRGFTPESFGVILAAGGLAFLASVLVYAWTVERFTSVEWHHYLYAMVALGVAAFPLSFYLYLDPGHPWWGFLEFHVPAWLDPLPHWNRYQWFRLAFQTLLGFATIPAFIIPLTIAGETVEVAYAGVGYAFLMSLSNVTNMFEGVVGAGLYDLLSSPSFSWVLQGFGRTPLNIAGVEDPRTLALQLFVYISLLFTLLTIPFIEMLRRELEQRGIPIRLGGGA